MDDADTTAERDVAEAPLRLAASRKPVGPQPNGRCHYCDDIVGDEDRWCGPTCRDMWEKDKRKWERSAVVGNKTCPDTPHISPNISLNLSLSHL